MINKTILAIVAVVVVAVIGVALMPPQTAAPTPADAPKVTQEESSPLGAVEVEIATPMTPAIPAAPVETSAPARSITVTFTTSGFSPSSVTVKKGDMVVFKNDSQKAVWPATDPHPQHTGYPEKGGCRGSAFDACKGIAPGDSWSFTFKEAGTWPYHDHLAASVKGVVVVE